MLLLAVQATIAGGAYPAPLHYYDFPKSVCTSINEVVCHGIPDARALKNGDVVIVDVTVSSNQRYVKKLYCSKHAYIFAERYMVIAS